MADRKGHEFSVDALKKMGTAANGMTIFLNHEYRVPEDLFGTIAASESKQAGYDSDRLAIWDLDFDVMVNEANPRAMQAWDAYEQGVRMGVSVGVLVKEWEKSKRNKEVMHILDVDFLEASIVGIPANPRTWVQGAVKSINAYSAAESEGLLETLDMLEKDAKMPTDEKKPKIDKDDEAPVLDADNEDSLSPTEVAKSVDGAEPPADDDAKAEATEELKGDKPDSDPEADAAGATQTALSAESLALSTTLASGSIDVLVNAFKAQLQEKDEEIARAGKERDEAQEQTRLALAIVEKIASLPVGRKASFRKHVSSFRRDLSGVYDQDFIAFLERTPE